MHAQHGVDITIWTALPSNTTHQHGHTRTKWKTLCMDRFLIHITLYLSPSKQIQWGELGLERGGGGNQHAQNFVGAQGRSTNTYLVLQQLISKADEFKGCIAALRVIYAWEGDGVGIAVYFGRLAPGSASVMAWIHWEPEAIILIHWIMKIVGTYLSSSLGVDSSSENQTWTLWQLPTHSVWVLQENKAIQFNQLNLGKNDVAKRNKITLTSSYE